MPFFFRLFLLASLSILFFFSLTTQLFLSVFPTSFLFPLLKLVSTCFYILLHYFFFVWIPTPAYLLPSHISLQLFLLSLFLPFYLISLPLTHYIPFFLSLVPHFYYFFFYSQASCSFSLLLCSFFFPPPRFFRICHALTLTNSLPSSSRVLSFVFFCPSILLTRTIITATQTDSFRITLPPPLAA